MATRTKKAATKKAATKKAARPPRLGGRVLAGTSWTPVFYLIDESSCAHDYAALADLVAWVGRHEASIRRAVRKSWGAAR